MNQLIRKKQFSKDLTDNLNLYCIFTSRLLYDIIKNVMSVMF